MSVADLRQNYEKFALLEDTAAATPLEQFGVWFEQALKAGVIEPNAMTLATARPDGRPSARTVLLKGYDERGFVFFTNYQSRKGRELADNPYASLLFFWPQLERQVRLEGVISKVPAAESDAYFHSRPLGSRIGAWVSPQSEPITRDELQARADDYAARLGTEPPRPDHWGGYLLAPDYVEFWQGRPSRLHDRLAYRLDPTGEWARTRLAP